MRVSKGKRSKVVMAVSFLGTINRTVLFALEIDLSNYLLSVHSLNPVVNFLCKTLGSCPTLYCLK
jgi:hypothetical protein